MKFQAAQCPNCGGALQLPDDRATVNCMYCGISIVVREAVQAAALGNVKNWLQIAATAAQSGNYHEAYDFYTRVLEVDGHDAEAWLGKAEAAGRMSTIQHFRLAELIIGITKALDMANAENRPDIEARGAGLIYAITSDYYHSLRNQIAPHLMDPKSWNEYVNQIGRIIKVLEQAHLLYPKNQNIIELILRIANEQLLRSGVAYKNNLTGQMNYRQLPLEQKLWLKNRSDYYLAEWRSLNPEAATPINKRSVLERFNKTQIMWIGIAVAAVAGFILLMLFVAALSESQRPTSRSAPAQRSPVSGATPTPVPVTAAQHLAEAKKALADGYAPTRDPMETRWGRVADARKHLEAIPSTASEYPEAQKVQREVKRREEAIERNSKVVARRVVVQQMEQKMLSEGMDAQFRVSGPDDTTLTITYVLMSRPLVYKLTTETEFLQNMRSAGFRKVTFTDGYDESWSYDL